MKWKTMNLNRVICLCSFLIFSAFVIYKLSCILSICKLLFIYNLFYFFSLLELAPKLVMGTDFVLD